MFANYSASSTSLRFTSLLFLSLGLLYCIVSALPLNKTQDLSLGSARFLVPFDDGIHLHERGLSDLALVEVGQRIQSPSVDVDQGKADFIDFSGPDCHKEPSIASRRFDGCGGLVVASRQGALVAHFSPALSENEPQFLHTMNLLSKKYEEHRLKLAGGKGYTFVSKRYPVLGAALAKWLNSNVGPDFIEQTYLETGLGGDNNDDGTIESESNKVGYVAVTGILVINEGEGIQDSRVYLGGKLM